MADHGVLQAWCSLADPVPLVLDGVLLHPRLETFPQAAVATLVPLVLVHCAVPREPTTVSVLLSNTPPEKSFAAIARSSSVVFSCCTIAAYGAVCWNDPTLYMMTAVHFCILKKNAIVLSRIISKIIYLRSIDVVEVNRGVRLVQVGNVITMFVDQTERRSCHSPKYPAS